MWRYRRYHGGPPTSVRVYVALERVMNKQSMSITKKRFILQNNCYNEMERRVRFNQFYNCAYVARIGALSSFLRRRKDSRLRGFRGAEREKRRQSLTGKNVVGDGFVRDAFGLTVFVKQSERRPPPRREDRRVAQNHCDQLSYHTPEGGYVALARHNSIDNTILRGATIVSSRDSTDEGVFFL